MSDPLTVTPRTPKRIGVAADHGGYELKEQLARILREVGYEVIDFGDHQLKPDDDYPDFVVPLARAVAHGDVDRRVAICGSGVGACIAANKVNIAHGRYWFRTVFSAHKGVEDDDMNVICFGVRVIDPALARDLVFAFLGAQFTGEERHVRPCRKWHNWRTRRQDHEKQSSEAIGNTRPIYLGGLHPGELIVSGELRGLQFVGAAWG